MNNQQPQPAGAAATTPGAHSALSDLRGRLLAVGLFSAVSNLLLLTGPLFMLQVYDRVLPARSAETLAALCGIVTFLFLVMGCLDAVRARILLRAAATVQTRLDPAAFAAARPAPASGEAEVPPAGPADLDTLLRGAGSPAATALFDLPFAPVFLAVLCLFHPLLGALAAAGAAVLVAAAALHAAELRSLSAQGQAPSRAAERIAAELSVGAASAAACGLVEGATAHWLAARRRALAGSLAAAERSAAFAAFSRGFRMYLQSAMLALAAWLFLGSQLSSGAIVAASVVMGRALAPLDQIAAGWLHLQALALALRRIRALARSEAPQAQGILLPRPAGLVEADGLVVQPPGATSPTLRGLTFRIGPGQALAVVGPSGSGKSTLAQAVAGALPVAQGSLRLDGAALDRSAGPGPARHVGYVPQRPHLLAATVGQNIARLCPEARAADIVAAARRAGAHEMILALPEGYDTPVGPFGAGLSGGQIQRIALARALFGDPVVLVLDEPDGALDPAGTEALLSVIGRHREAGGTVIVCTHRGATIGACDSILMLEAGRQRAFGSVRELVGQGSGQGAAQTRLRATGSAGPRQ